jgi:ATP adenylyltransferase
MLNNNQLEHVEDAADLGVKDTPFDVLWTPYRMAYINGETPRGKENANGGKDECPFCVAPSKTDEEGLIVYRGKLAYALMNLFPYNSAHMLVCPYRHVSLYEEATPEERAEIAEITAHALQVIRKTIKPDGFNLGMNQGEVAGAGIAAHLHQHIVPRWAGDANFFPIIANTKTVPTLIETARQQIQDAW